MNKKLLILFSSAVMGIAFLTIVSDHVEGQYAVGTRMEPLMVISNSGRVFYDTNAVTATRFWFDRPIDLSNGMSVASGQLTSSVPTTVRGMLSVERGLKYSITNMCPTAITNNNVDVTGLSAVVVTGISSSIEWTRWTGFAGGQDGQVLTFINTTPNSAQFANANASSYATNQINNCGLGDTNTTSAGIATFIYCVAPQGTNWYLRSIVY